MPLLLLPLLLLALLLVMVLAWPWTLRQRYRLGVARRRVYGWQVRANAWLLSLSVLGYLAGAWLMSRWLPDALRDAGLALAAGAAFGLLGHALTRFEALPDGLYRTPPRWIVLAVVALVAGRAGYALWLAVQRLRSGSGWDAWLRDDGALALLAVAGLLLGYQWLLGLGLRHRLREITRPLD